MKFYLIIVFIFIFTIDLSKSRANTLFDSLNSAYLNNLKLNAERASVRATKEEKNESISEFLPSITVSGYISEQRNTGDTISKFEPSEQALELEQKIFQCMVQAVKLDKNSL